MSALALAGAAALTGLLGGVHCAGMCGGIVLGLSRGGGGRLPMALAYNAGRVGTYAALGALAGSVGAGLGRVPPALSAQLLLFVAAQLMLVALGAHLAGLGGPLPRLEAAGARLWARVRPLGRVLAGGVTPRRALCVGAAWGLLPCGMVYSLLVSAGLAGSPLGGAAVMAAFGAGTLPALLLSAAAAGRLRAATARSGVRRAVGALVAAFGVFGLVRLPVLAEVAHRGMLCITG